MFLFMLANSGVVENWPGLEIAVENVSAQLTINIGSYVTCYAYVSFLTRKQSIIHWSEYTEQDSTSSPRYWLHCQVT